MLPPPPQGAARRDRLVRRARMLDQRGEARAGQRVHRRDLAAESARDASGDPQRRRHAHADAVAKARVDRQQRAIEREIFEPLERRQPAGARVRARPHREARSAALPVARPRIVRQRVERRLEASQRELIHRLRVELGSNGIGQHRAFDGIGHNATADRIGSAQRGEVLRHPIGGHDRIGVGRQHRTFDRVALQHARRGAIHDGAPRRSDVAALGRIGVSAHDVHGMLRRLGRTALDDARRIVAAAVDEDQQLVSVGIEREPVEPPLTEDRCDGRRDPAGLVARGHCDRRDAARARRRQRREGLGDGRHDARRSRSSRYWSAR